MDTLSSLNPAGPTSSATPEAASILSSVPGISVVVRNAAHQVVECNAAFADTLGRSPEALRGTTLRDYCEPAAAAERTALLDIVLNEHAPRDYLQFWGGKAWLGRVLPLDQDAYGMRGTLGVITPAPIGTPLADLGEVQVLTTAEFGGLTTLTTAEKRTIFDLAMGRSNNEIATRQDRSVRTIECHVRAIHDKLGTSSRSAIIRESSERGIQLFTESQWDAMVGTKHARKRSPRRVDPSASRSNGVGIIEAKS